MALTAPTWASAAPTSTTIPGAPTPTANTQKVAASPGSYMGTVINPGTDAQIAAQVAAINTQKSSQPTVLSSTNIDQKNQDNMAKVNSTTPTGQVVGADGVARNADGSPAEAPSGSTPVTDTNGNTYYSNGAIKYATATSVSDDPYTQAIFDQLSSLKGQMDATGAANIANIQAQYGSLIETQKQINKSQEAGTYSLLARGGSLQTESSGGIIQSQISSGIKSIADLIVKENQATIAAQQAAQDGDYKILDKQLSIASDARKARVDAANRVSDQLIQAKKDAQAKLDATDKSIQDLMVTASKGGKLTPDQQAAFKTALANHDYAAAVTAGGDNLQASSDPKIAEYLQYKKDAAAAGQTPMSYLSYQNTQAYNQAYSTAKGTAAGKLAGEGGGTGGGGGLTQSSITSKESFPQALKPYAKQSGNGTWYLDLSSIGANQRDGLIAQAGNLPVITDKNQAADLVNIKDAYGKLNTIAIAMKDMTSASALSRDLGGAGLSALSAMAQTNPSKAAAQALNDSALDFLKAISGVQGFRGNQSAIQQIKDSLPKITDTQDVVAQKLSYIAQQMADRENATVGEPGNRDVTSFVIRSEDQATNALIDAGKTNPDVQNQINKVANTVNPDTGQKYTALETAQILGIDIPALSSQREIGQGGTLMPNFWREVGVTQ